MKQVVGVFVMALLVTSACLFSTTAKGGEMARVDPDLRALYDSYGADQGAAIKLGRFPLMRIVEDRVVIDAVASGDVQALKADLDRLGMQNAIAAGRIVSGQLPIRAIDALEGLASLQFARPAYSTTHTAPLTRPR
jgi:hypothetical protein